MLPVKPYKPQVGRNLALAAFLGLFFGVGLAFAMEYCDDTIKSLDDLERACNMPSLGILPQLDGKRLPGKSGIKSNILTGWGYFSRLQRGSPSNDEGENLDLIVSTKPMSQVSEAILHVYSSLMLSTSGKPPTSIMVTSPNPVEGKTMIVSNLALACALNDRPVIIVDCDLRKPRLHKIFGVNSQPGLTNYLTGNAPLEEILRPTDIPNLTIITSGAKPPSPANLLNSGVFKELLTQLRQQFYHVIIDTPPVLGFADARFISILVDGVLLVTRQNSTHKSAGSMAHQLLSFAPVLGAIINFVGPHGLSYGNYYYYNYYKYYSKYYDGKES
jgi:capsular exopolysaccharide synthesis family protein